MKPNPSILATVLGLSLLTLSAAQAQTMSKADYKANKAKIIETYKTDKAACKTQSGNAKEVCSEEAKAKEKVALAELEFIYTGKPADQNKVLVVKARTAYDVAKERCDDQAGNAKKLCVQEAKAAEQKALAEAKVTPEKK